MQEARQTYRDGDGRQPPSGGASEAASTSGMLPTIPAWLVWLTAACFVFAGLGSFGILDNNEGLYAEIPREMLQAGTWQAWVIPHLNGLPYMEKPPLLYWLTALSFGLFGEAEWAARLAPALSALACVGIVLGFGKAAGQAQAARLAALMFISGLGVMAMSHVLMFDMLLTALLTAALALAYRFDATGRASRLRASHACLALALLAKGFVALILFGLVLFAYLAVTAGSARAFLRALRRWLDPLALLLLLAIAAPWHIAASLTEPIFAWFYFINEHVLRFLGRREPHDYYSGAWWYYLPRMAIYLFPWSFLLPFLLRAAKPEAAQGDSALRLNRFLACAWIMPLAFFSVSSAKANYYLVAVMPFAALHLALALARRAYLSPMRRMLPGLLIAALCLIGLVALLKRAPESGESLIIMGLQQREFALLAVGILLALALLAAWLAGQGGMGLYGYGLIPAWLSIILLQTLAAMEPAVSTRQMANYLKLAHPDRQIYLYRKFEEQSSLPFYLKKPLPVVDMQSNDLFWGNRLRPGNSISVSIEKFNAAKSAKLALVVMDRQRAEFEASPAAAGLQRVHRVGNSTLYIN
ncbi:4-amino-4-deoxy-L-arabinose transferase [Noviherbaspirillum humi]|uniref:4-amino-4-deoxy-L-arabinose transferase n=1 Tax=Noviherbaspirillum humi TaxID=1688639 RepID=A0A239G2Q4_9BURK|nr:glycosyltransferase family 39 protein [Noviherbaspirillum humi]SNS62988.1 4-amino-4-deoxy-L-arabinose transferase [Noviherbaspirillum humi]